jgi:hypothetical protein
MGDNKRRFGDRYDGRLIRTLNPFYKMIPFIMHTRSDAQNFFDDRIDIGHTESFLRSRRKTIDENIGFLHVVIAAMVRTISQKPGLNRFIAGQKIFARNEILVSLALKKKLEENSPETTIKMRFEPTDTLKDIAAKINKMIMENKKLEIKNDADKTAKLFMLCPGLLVKFLVWFLRSLDYFGIMPKVINRVSPFHTSVFITDLGSLGIQPIYHHLYDFGTTSVFIAFGTKLKEKQIDANNNFVEKRFVQLRAVTDERIVDGHYYASAFKLFKYFIQHPEKLEHPPEHILNDID